SSAYDLLLCSEALGGRLRAQSRIAKGRALNVANGGSSDRQSKHLPWSRGACLVCWTNSQLAATIIARSCSPPENRASGVRALTFRVQDATQTIPTFCPGLSRASRIVGRSTDYWRVLSTVVHLGDQYSNSFPGFNLWCSILRGFGDRRSDRDGFGRVVWTSELRGFSPPVGQDSRRHDTRADACLFLRCILARRTGLPAGPPQLSLEGDPDLACLRVGDAQYLLGDFRPRDAEATGPRARQRGPG